MLYKVNLPFGYQDIKLQVRGKQLKFVMYNSGYSVGVGTLSTDYRINVSWLTEQEIWQNIMYT